MKPGTVSIVINCYNGSVFLREAIDSVIKQNYLNWEIIFWDNQSTDNSAEIIRSYKDSRICYFFAPTHTKLGEARYLAVNQCQGEYISFLDTDDVYYPDNLDRKIEFLERETADVVYGGAVYISKSGEEIGRHVPRYKSGMLFESFLYQFDIEVASMMIRRSALIEDNLNFDKRIYGSEEYDLLLNLSVQHRFAVINQSLSRVRIHVSSLTYAVMEKWALDRRLTLNKIVDHYPGVKEKFPNAFREAFARADYYEVRWLVHEGRLQEAVKIIKKIALVDWRYFLLFILLKAGPSLWLFIHKFAPSSRRG